MFTNKVRPELGLRVPTDRFIIRLGMRGLLALLCAGVVAGCDRAMPPTPVVTESPAARSASATIRGVVPIANETPAASDRDGVPAIGAIEAGQARGGANMGGAPERTGGAEGPASAPR